MSAFGQALFRGREPVVGTMEELRLLLDFRETPGEPEAAAKLRASLMRMIDQFAKEAKFKVIVPPVPDTFNSPASNRALTIGWKAEPWPLEPEE